MPRFRAEGQDEANLTQGARKFGAVCRHKLRAPLGLDRAVTRGNGDDWDFSYSDMETLKGFPYLPAMYAASKAGRLRLRD
jgi:hypothetical protein